MVGGNGAVLLDWVGLAPANQAAEMLLTIARVAGAHLPWGLAETAAIYSRVLSLLPWEEVMTAYRT